MTTVLFDAGAARWPDWEQPLKAALSRAGVTADLVLQAEPGDVDAIIYAPSGGTISDFAPYVKCKLVQNLWAGVEQITGNRTLTQPLCRMVDPGLTQGMVEYVVGHVLRAHLHTAGTDAARQGSWVPEAPPLASERPVAMLGLGALGIACGRALAGLGFPVLGWSRSAKQHTEIACHHGDEGLRRVLDQAQIVVTLLPDTPATTNLIDARTLGWMPRGAALINPGRGTLIDDDALLAALDSGHVGHATLDVFRTEPLPADHRYWAHPSVTVTPHIAADTRHETAAQLVAENLRRMLAGAPLLHQVDRAAGY